MSARWAPIAAAAAVAGLVVTIALVTGGGADPDASRALGAGEASPTASPVAPASDEGQSPEPSTAPDTPVSTQAAAPSAKPSAASPAAEPPSSPAPRPARPAPSPASAKPVPPPPPPPPPPASPEPAQQPGRSALPFDAAYGTDEPYEVIVQYGDSGSCPHENVTKKVRETADTVVVALTADTQPADRACTADYRQMLVPVPLSQPLGSRRVIDAATGREVEVDRKCSRPFRNPPPPKDCTA